MKITFLGTGAADWDINSYVHGEEFRRYSSALVDTELLIDAGPHIFHFAENEGQPEILSNVKNAIITHSHWDHFNPEIILKLAENNPDFTLWGDAACLRAFHKRLGEENTSTINFVELPIGETHDVGGYMVTALPASHITHDPAEFSRVYLIEKDGRTLFYGCDCAWLPSETWAGIVNKQINLMVLECTCGELAINDWRSFDHNDIKMLENMIIVFRKYNYFAEDVRFVASHLARELHPDHATVAKAMEAFGATPAYDGMVLEV